MEARALSTGGVGLLQILPLTSKSLSSEAQFPPLGDENNKVHPGYAQVRCKVIRHVRKHFLDYKAQPSLEVHPGDAQLSPEAHVTHPSFLPGIFSGPDPS